MNTRVHTLIRMYNRAREIGDNPIKLVTFTERVFKSFHHMAEITMSVLLPSVLSSLLFPFLYSLL